MKIISTALLLGLTLLAVPAFSYFFGTALGPLEWTTLNHLILLTGVMALLCFIVGELTQNNSQVDKLWSILPIVYVWMVAAKAGYDPRLVLMASLVSLWGIRLTANFAMKGAYRLKFWEGEEDYRWKILRQKNEFKAPWKWTIFNFLFISSYQNVLILLFTLPSIVALQNRNQPLGFYDFLVAGLMLIFICYETIADLQQWRYQSEKLTRIRAGLELSDEYKKGFLDKGLWAWSRHPNYFAEQAIWICFYLFSVIASGQWFNWSIIGCILLVLLFQGSSKFSEEISAGKYPDYQTYQEKVPRFIPFKRRSI
jgi:steroid 5-alpha reductase family enzyme